MFEVFRFTSQPSLQLPLQLPRPALQTRLQTPLSQVALACVPPAQVSPQPPQWVVLVNRFVLQPVFQLLSQFPRLLLHSYTQDPLTQALTDALLGVLLAQELLQAPQ